MVSYLCTRNQRYNTCLSVSESRIAPENIYIYTYKYVAFLVSEMECSQTTRNARFTFNKWKTDTNNPVAHREVSVSSEEKATAHTDIKDKIKNAKG